MLPEEIVELCSLTRNKKSSCIAMDIIIKNDGTYNVLFANVIICPYANHVYESSELFADPNYKWLIDCTKKTTDIEDSHKLVEYYMRKMCFEAGRVLHENNAGIYRTINEPLEDIYPSNSYVLTTLHTPYAHITSPIRRIIDILNQIKLYEVLGLQLSNAAYAFYDEWIEKLEYINKTSKDIKKVQNDCALLNLYPTICNNSYEGIILDKETVCINGIYTYTIFLKELNLIAKLNSLKIIQGVRHYKLYMFEHKDTLKKKIKLCLCG
jgi:exoribonuclease R